MKYAYSNEQHDALTSILDARNRKSITPDMPLWKLKLTEEEYVSPLKWKLPYAMPNGGEGIIMVASHPEKT